MTRYSNPHGIVLQDRRTRRGWASRLVAAAVWSGVCVVTYLALVALGMVIGYALLGWPGAT